MTFTTNEIARLRKICKDAHPGPWTHVIDGIDSYVGAQNRRFDMEIVICTVMAAFSNNEEDGVFIAAAREALPLLLDEVERLQQKIKDQ